MRSFLFFPHLSPLYDKTRRGLIPWRRQASWVDPLAVCVYRLAYIQARSHALTSDRHQVGFQIIFLFYPLCVFKPWRCCSRCCSSLTGSLQGGPLDVGSAEALETSHIHSLQTTFSHDNGMCFTSPCPCFYFWFNTSRSASSGALLRACQIYVFA